ncbi:hypothetical protein PG991_008222 [Apiospora marii]|uniref:Uncharacterized protein n=1 Tax=Apiospora marii TaxID=335849 RepID=A0ABR1RQA3_9PEZI
MNLFSDNACQDPVPGSGWTTVNSGSCDANVGTGWQSARITDNRDSPAGTLTFYTHNDCAAGQSSHGYSAANFACLNNFGFVANAVGLTGNLCEFLNRPVPKTQSPQRNERNYLVNVDCLTYVCGVLIWGLIICCCPHLINEAAQHEFMTVACVIQAVLLTTLLSPLKLPAATKAAVRASVLFAVALLLYTSFANVFSCLCIHLFWASTYCLYQLASLWSRNRDQAGYRLRLDGELPGSDDAAADRSPRRGGTCDRE